MELVAEYLRRAEECRQLAKQTTTADHRKAIEEICKAWTELAEERRRYVEERRKNLRN